MFDVVILGEVDEKMCYSVEVFGRRCTFCKSHYSILRNDLNLNSISTIFFFSSKSLSSIFYQKLKQNAKISRIFPASSSKLPSSARTVIQKFDQPLFRSDKAQTRSANVYKSAVNAPKCNLPSVSVWNSHLDGR